jgi:hypothetical protein
MPTGVYPRPSARSRFDAKVDRSGEHWLWTGGTTKHGYGVFWLDGHLVHAHRAALLFEGVALTDDQDVDHVCRVRLCVRPTHLEAVSHLVNVQRALPHRPSQLTDVCRHGHERTPENTYQRPDGFRACRPCQREYSKRSRAA